MKDADFPALYRSANALSISAQNHFLIALGTHLASLVVAAVISVINSPHWCAAVLQSILLLLALSCSIYLGTVRPDRTWYAARAVAESVKTVAWRYMCKAEPFDLPDVAAKHALSTKLRAIIDQNKEVARKFKDHLTDEQITDAMHTVRSGLLRERREADWLSRTKFICQS